MKVKITESQLRQLVRESLEEMVDEEGMDEGRLSNFFNSLGKGIQGTVRGGLDQGRQMYNQNMAQMSQADADAAEQQAAEFRAKQNAGYKDIPQAQEIAQKFDGKIGKLRQEIAGLQAQKKAEMQAARREYMSKMGKQVSKFNNKRNSFANTANNANATAANMLNRRRASLGLDPVGQAQGSMVAESKLEKIIKESIKKVLN